MRSFAKNFRTFLLALALGISVWVSAVSAADPNEVRSFPNAIPLEVVGLDPSLVLTSETPRSVDVTLRAPRSVWDVLTARDGAVRAILDLSAFSAGEHTKEIQLIVSERPYQVVFVNPSAVTVTLESIASRTFSVTTTVRGQPATGYQAGDATTEVDRVAISGPESLVKRAVRAIVVVNLDNVRDTIDEALPVQIMDEDDNVIQGLTINPETVRVNIPISQQGGFRDLAVKVVVQGQQAPGYRIENISVFPPVITIFAEDPERVNELPGVVETMPLDLQGQSEDISTRLSLNLPEGITLVGAQTVQVNVNISPIQTSLTLLNQPISIVGLQEGLSAQVFPQTVDVIISGPVPVLDALASQDVSVSVDVSDLEIGVYQLTPQVNVLLEDVLVESILPGTVEVVIALPTTPTPTAFPQ
jgi:YbbR domain-containing protein